jgi:hypothetical protein
VGAKYNCPYELRDTKISFLTTSFQNPLFS